jgi:hypothetical protein
MEMFDYTICNQTDETLFKKQCTALEKNIPGLVADKLLESPDGTLIQQYKHKKGFVAVKNDTQVDALYIISDFDLLPYFGYCTTR